MIGIFLSKNSLFNLDSCWFLIHIFSFLNKEKQQVVSFLFSQFFSLLLLLTVTLKQIKIKIGSIMVVCNSLCILGRRCFSSLWNSLDGWPKSWSIFCNLNVCQDFLFYLDSSWFLISTFSSLFLFACASLIYH